MRGSLDVKWSDVIDAHIDDKALRVGLGLRVPGTWIPGLIVAGTYYWAHVWTFAFWRRGQQPLVVNVRNLRWSRLVIGVPSASEVVRQINERIAASH
jgi:hypothetical protein